MADSMGTDVKSAKTSYEVMHSVGCNLIPLTCCTKSPVFLIWCGDFPTRGLRILKRTSLEDQGRRGNRRTAVQEDVPHRGCGTKVLWAPQDP